MRWRTWCVTGDSCWAWSLCPGWIPCRPDRPPPMTIGSVSTIPACSLTFSAAFVILDRGAVLGLVGTEPGFVILNEEWRRRPEY